MKMSPEQTGSCNSLPNSKRPEDTKAVRENNELSISENLEDLLMKECYAEPDSLSTLNQMSSCDNSDSDSVYREIMEESGHMDIVSSIIADVYAADMVRHSPTFSWSSGTDSPLNVLSDSEYYLWDYDSIDLWNLDDV